MQRRRTVEHHWVLRNGLFQHVPDLWALALHHALCGLDVLSVVVFDQALHNEGLEQLECHQLRQTTLVQLQLRTDDNNGTTGVVHALTQQVLAETTLLTLQQVRQRLQRAVARAGNRTATTAVIEERVHRLLQHALLVIHDDLWCAQVDHALQAVIAVDNAAVQVIQVRGGEAATVQLHHRAQLRRDNRNSVQHHACRVIAGVEECGNNLEALKRAHLLLALAVVDDLTQLLGLCLEVEVAYQGLDGFCTHAAGEVILVAVNQLFVDGLIDDHLLRSKLQEGVPDFIQACDFPLAALADVLHFLISSVLYLLAGIGTRTGCLQLSQVGLELGSALCDLGLGIVLNVLLLQQHFRFQGGLIVVASLFINGGDDVGSEVDDALKVLRSQVQQVAQAGRNALEVPDVGYRSGQLDVAHALTTHLGLGDLNAATLTDDALVADALVLTTSTLPVTGRSENALAEQAVLFRLQRAVVNGLGLFNLALRPATDIVSSGQTDAELVEEIYVKHVMSPFHPRFMRN